VTLFFRRLHAKLDAQHKEQLGQAATHHAALLAAVHAAAVTGDEAAKLLADVKAAVPQRRTPKTAVKGP
jgi:hypothetical protein